jgi:outer membrane protein TolC
MKSSLLVGLVVGLTGLASQLCAQEPRTLTLDEAVATALDVSPDLRSLVIQENSALDSYHWSLREFLPKVGLNYSQNQSVLLSSPDTRSVQAGLTLKQLVFDAGRGGRKKDLARVQMVASRQDFQWQEEQVTDSVQSLFNQILVLKKKLEIQSQVIELAQKQLDISKAEVHLGSAREIDYLETAAQVSSLQVDKKQSERSLRDAVFQLANLLGFDPEIPLDVVGSFDADYQGLSVPDHSERWLAEALETSKDLIAQRLDLRKQYFELLNANLWYLPDVTLETSLSLTGATLPLQTPAYNATLTFSFPVEAFPVTQTLALGTTPGQSRTSSVSSNVGILDSVQGFVDSSTARAEFQLIQAKEGVLRATTRYNLEKTLGDYRLLVEKLALQRNTVALEEKKNGILAKQVELGEAKRLDYLQGETKLASDRIVLVESVLQVKESERTLEQLLHRPSGTLAQAVEEEKS